MNSRITRRKLLHIMGGISASLALPGVTGCRSQQHSNQPMTAEAEAQWNQGELAHLIPTANHERFLIKTSFKKALSSVPLLRIGNRFVNGGQNDTDALFWQFDATGLSPDTDYELQLMANRSQPLCDAWSLKTFPHPDQPVEHLRILTYTCAGGDEDLVQADGVATFIPLEHRQRLLARGLAMHPDIVIANGDHIYWDERTMTKNKPQIVIDTWRRLQTKLGVMNRNIPVLGTANEEILKRVADRQIAQLYGVSLRSTPSFMLTDDHDLFDNDEATEEFITLPPDGHMLEAARATQHLYYPEFLPDPNRPLTLPGSAATDRAEGLSESFGTIRYGRLFEGLLYDTKRHVSIEGESGVMAPRAVEEWLALRTKDESTAHLVHIPSTPVGWSAGKWGEWYPDLLTEDGALGITTGKPYWPSGWWRQHQRILKMLGSQKQRTPLIVSGDLHMFAGAKILRSGDQNFSANPIHTVVVGPLGTGAPAFPSAARGVLPQAPTQMALEEYQPPLEKNGFTIIDITADAMIFEMYAWRSPEPVDLIDLVTPVKRFVISRHN